MPAFFDASCPKCGKRFGWQGELTDKPPCSRCGHQDDKAKLQKDKEKMDRLREEMLKNE